ncbi:MAG: chromophore lyase CpcT/CpeT [Cryomorphaceae bacterium]
MKPIVVFLLASFILPCKGQTLEEADLALLSESMIGTFTALPESNAEQAESHQHLTVTRIWKREAEVWIYAEQSAGPSKDQLLRQQVFQLGQNGKNKFILTLFEVHNEAEWTKAGDKPKSINHLSPADLHLQAGCAIGLVYSQGTFVGSTQDRCISNRQGASLATTDIRISRDQTVIWERGWDEQGNQIWGPTARGITYIK